MSSEVGPNEAPVVVAPDSAGGTPVRTVQVVRMDSDGTIVVERQQVISIADAGGTVIDLDFASRADEMIDLLKDIRRLLHTMAEDVTGDEIDLSEQDD